MKNLTLFGIQAVLLLLIAASHAYALSVDLYWQYPFVNRVIHFSGGLWVALAALWLFTHRGERATFTRVIAIVIAISIAWEIFELAIGLAKQEANYVLDTTLDLVMDLLGGALGYFVGSSMVQWSINGETSENNSS